MEKANDLVERSLVSRIMSIVVENGGLSIGRTLLMSIFVLSMVQWGRGIEIPSSQVTILMVLFGYVLGSKAIGNVSETVGKVMDTKKVLAAAIKGEDVQK